MYLKKALEINPNHLRSKVLKIILTLKADWNTKNTYKSIESILAEHKNNPLVAGDFGDVFIHSGQSKKAIDILNQSLILDPKNSSIHARLALQYLILGNINLAEKHNSEAVKLSPNYQMVLHIRSLILMKQNIELILVQLTKKI